MKNTNRKIALAEFALLVVAFIWGGGFVAGKFALEGASPFWVMALRYLGAALVLALCSIPKLKTMTKNDWKYGSLIGLLMYGGVALQTFALHYTTPGKQSFIVVSYTVIVPLIVWAMYRKRPASKELVAAVISMVGVALLSLNEQLSVGIGELMTFVFAIAFSLQIVLTGRYTKRVSLIPFTLAQVFCAGVFSLISALLFEPAFSFSTLTQTSVMGILYLALLNTAAAFLLQNVAQRYARPSHTALIMAVESVFGAVDAVVLTGEIFTPRMLVGCILVLFSAVMSKLESGGKKAVKSGSELDEKKEDGASAVPVSRPAQETDEKDMESQSH